MLSALDAIALAAIGHFKLIGSAKRGLFWCTPDDLEDFECDGKDDRCTLFLTDDRCDFWLRGGGDAEIPDPFLVIMSGCVVATD